MDLRIPLERIIPNPDQPRKHFDAKKLADLAASIRSRGLKQPIVVRPIDQDRFMIVMGERRWRAHRLLVERGEWPDGTIRAHIENVEQTEMEIDAIIENLQRENITPLEEARAFERMIDKGFSEDSLSEALGLTQKWRVPYRLRLLKLSPEILTLAEGGAISWNMAHAIGQLASHDQTRVVRSINSGTLRNDTQVYAAVNAILDGLSQSDFFGSSSKPTEKDMATVTAMESKVDRCISVIASGFDEGECVVATRISPDRAGKMADQLALIAKHARIMENQLRAMTAQAAMVSGKA